MANPCFLVESNFSFNPLLQQAFHLPPLRSHPITLPSGDNTAFKLNYSPYKIRHRKYSIFAKGSRDDNHLKTVGTHSDINKVEAVVGVGPVVGVQPSTKEVSGDSAMLLWGMVFGATLTVLARLLMIAATNRISILKLQVGLSGMGKCISLQRDVNRIAARPYDRFENGAYVLQETTLALLRHPECCTSGSSSVYMKMSTEEVGIRFNQLCLLERGKFDVHTLVNVNKVGLVTTARSRDFCNDYMVVTIIVAVEGGHKLPQIDTNAQLKEALQILATLSLTEVLAVAVLLTPQNENDSHTEQKFLENYSYMCPL